MNFSRFMDSRFEGLLLPLMQGKFMPMMERVCDALKKYDIPMSRVRDSYFGNYMAAGDKYDVDAALREIGVLFGGDEDLALDAIHIADLAEGTRQAVDYVAQCHVAKPPTLQDFRYKKEMLEEVKSILIDEGGIGLHQAELLTKTFVTSVEKATDEYYQYSLESARSQLQR